VATGLRLALAVVVLAALVVLGCRTRGFVREGATQQVFYQDLQECEQQAAAKAFRP
jgi:hypothetical protein